MSRKIAVSFEDDAIKAVYASVDRGRIVVDKTLILKDDELDAFLLMEKMTDFIIVGHFSLSFSDVLTAPPAKKTYLRKIIESEIQKRSPEFKAFSYAYHTIGKKPLESKAQEIFFYAVEDAELDVIINRFKRCGKKISQIYSDTLVLAQLISSSANYADSTLLGLYVTDESKNLLLLKNGSLRFARTTPSFGRTVEAVDIDNINMTVSYCRQTFKTNPDQILLLNTPLEKDQPPLGTIVKAFPFPYPESIEAPVETIGQFLAPIAAIAVEGRIREGNLMPRKYREMSIQKMLVASLIGLFMLLALVGAGYTVKNLADILSLKGKITTLRHEMKGAKNIAAEYDQFSVNLQQMLPLINLMNEAHSAPDIQKGLAAYRFLPMKNVAVHDIQVTNQKDSLKLHLSGGVAAGSFAERHRIFQEFVAAIGKTPGMTVMTQSIELKDGKFQIDVHGKL